MITTLKGAALYVAGAIVLAIVGAVTYLAEGGSISGSDALTVYTVVLTGAIGLGAAQVTGAHVISAAQLPPPGPASAVAPTTPAPAAEPAPGPLV